VEPRIQYAKTSDGVSIAYTVFGDGPPLMIPPSLTASHLQMEWAMPARRAAFERLSTRATLVHYDPRGVGMSRGAEADYSLEAASRDLEAVAEAAGVDRFAIYARLQMGDLPIAYAARNPEKITHLILYRLYQGATTSLGRRLTPFAVAMAPQDWDLFANVFSRLATDWDSPDAAPLAALIKDSQTPEGFLAAWQAIGAGDPFKYAGEIRIPTLILHPMSDVAAGEAARDLAAIIPDARVAGIPGDSFAGYANYPNAAGIDVIHDFIGAPPGHEQALSEASHDTGAFRTILFTDIVAHTSMMERLGDEAGRDVLRDHERIIRRALAEHGGSEIKTIGDSFMASFSSAQRAVECAIALQRAFATTEIRGERLRVRSGVNAGEPIHEGDDLFGASVILAARAKETAAEGEIVVTDVVRQLVTGKGFLFAERGSVALRGFEEPVRLFEVRWREDQ
jgi:class 3 adenylate cyclase/pimeloyl-ACP methyl ester carboxylesterase